MKKMILVAHALIFIFLLTPLTSIAQKTASKFNYGKYGCTAGKYQNGSYEFIPRRYIFPDPEFLYQFSPAGI